MANSLTPQDVYTIVNTAAQQMFGASAIQAVDTTTFTSVGEAMLNKGYESTLNALGYVIGRTYIAVRPYSGSFALINADTETFGGIARKISYFYDATEASNDWNTNLNAEQLKDGKSVDMYSIRKRYPLEMQFNGRKVLQKSYTRFLYQLKGAFKSETDFAMFYEGLAVEVANELEILRETESRLTVLNYIGGLYHSGKDAQKINLTAEFNAKYGTSYTSEELRTTYLADFTKFFVSRMKYTMELMKTANTIYHLTPTKTNDNGEELQLLRHTPYDLQRLLVSSELFIDAETNVFSSVFNDAYLKLNQAERIAYWQTPATPGAVMVKPNVLDVTTGVSKDANEAVNIPYVVGVLYDRDALMVAYQVDEVLTTPVNAKGSYYNTVYHWSKDYRNDFTENGVLFYMEDPT